MDLGLLWGVLFHQCKAQRPSNDLVVYYQYVCNSDQHLWSKHNEEERILIRFGSCGCGLSCMIRLYGPYRDEHVCPFILGITHNILQLAGFVSATNEASEIISLHPKRRTIQKRSEKSRQVRHAMINIEYLSVCLPHQINERAGGWVVLTCVAVKFG